MKGPRPVELLAPARDAATAIAAIDHGADAVYIGAPSHGARAAATNSLDDIRRVVEYAHRFRARVYVTVNTLVYPDEIPEVERLIVSLYDAGVDALIVQDMGILRMKIPPIALHASTQCDTRTPEKARFLEQAGFSQIVLARELTLDEISAVSAAVKVPLEAFVHGALCVSFSGDCQASFMASGRSANRGECAQMCRLPYSLTDENGKTLMADKHLLSLKDMNRMELLDRMLEAGVSSFKIEGRLKDISYVKNVTAAYRAALDRIIAANPDRYCRASLGNTDLKFTPSVEHTFNRGFTSYFLTERRQQGIASMDSPKSVGIPVGRVSRVGDNWIAVKTDVNIANGDGLGFYDRTGRFTGFRANRVADGKIFLREKVSGLERGIMLYRNRDRMRDAEMSGETAIRTIPVGVTLRITGDRRVAMDIEIKGIGSASACVEADISEARTPQGDAHRRVAGKLGDTVYRLDTFNDFAGDSVFIPASQLTQLRRDAVAALDVAMKASYPRELRRAEMPEAVYREHVVARDNVSNPLAREFYLDHGAKRIDSALEVHRPASGEETQVMECRYCLRRELGACLRTADGRRLPPLLYLQHGPLRYRLDFNCRDCMMRVVQVSGNN